MQNCITELNQLKIQLLNVQISEQVFCGNDDKTKFYTGIANFVMLTHVFKLVQFKFNLTLPKFLEFRMKLMNLELNCSFQDLAYPNGFPFE